MRLSIACIIAVMAVSTGSAFADEQQQKKEKSASPPPSRTAPRTSQPNGVRPAFPVQGQVRPGFPTRPGPFVQARPGFPARPGPYVQPGAHPIYHPGYQSAGGATHARFDYRSVDRAHWTPTLHAAWRAGQWQHEWNHGRYGWWWRTGGGLYFYDAPVYPYPEIVSEDAIMEAPVAEAPAAGGFWYFCDSAGGYYPSVPNCPTPWRPIPATP